MTHDEKGEGEDDDDSEDEYDNDWMEIDMVLDMITIDVKQLDEYEYFRAHMSKLFKENPDFIQ